MIEKMYIFFPKTVKPVCGTILSCIFTRPYTTDNGTRWTLYNYYNIIILRLLFRRIHYTNINYREPKSTDICCRSAEFIVTRFSFGLSARCATIVLHVRYIQCDFNDSCPTSTH